MGSTREMGRLHVSFQRLLASCEKLVARDTSEGADVRQMRRLEAYLPVLSRQLAQLKEAETAVDATSGAAPSGSSASADDVKDMLVALPTASQLKEYTRQLNDLQAVVATARTVSRKDSSSLLVPLLPSTRGGKLTSRMRRRAQHEQHAQLLGEAGVVESKASVAGDADGSTPPPAVTDSERDGSDESVTTGAGVRERRVAGARRRKKDAPLTSEDYDRIVAERDLQSQIESDMVPMASSFLEAAKLINQRLAQDNRLLDDASAVMDDNVDKITKVKDTLDKQNSTTRWSMLRTLLMLVGVSVVFLLTYALIRLTPNPSR